MSITFDNASDRLLRTTDLLNKNAAYTWMAWFYPTATTGTRTLFSLNDNGGNYDFIGMINGLTLYVETQDVSGSLSTLAAANAWYHITIQRAADANSLHLFVNGVEDGSGFSDIAGGRSAASRMEMGGFESGNANPFQGNIAYIKAWGAVLSSAEILAEKDSAAAVRTSNLYGEWKTPLGATRTADTSGNGRDWTAGGTLTDSSDYPFGGGTTQDLAGTSSLTFASSAVLSFTKPLAATSDLTFGGGGALSVVKPLAGVSNLTFGATARLADFGFIASDHQIVGEPRNQQIAAAARNVLVEAAARSASVQATARNYQVVGAPRNYTVL